MVESKPFSVLLIDDDPYMRDLFEIILEHHHVSLATANNAQSAFDYLAHDVPDAIVVDMILPDMDGYRVLTRLRQNAATQKVKVFLTTTYYTNNTASEVSRYGFDGYLPKPINPTTVVGYIQNIIGQG